MTHFNPMKGPGFGEPDVPPSQDLDDYDPTVYQVCIGQETRNLHFNALQ